MKKYLSAFCVATFFSLSPYAQLATAGNSVSAEEWVRQANRLLENHQPDSAIFFYEKAIIGTKQKNNKVQEAKAYDGVSEIYLQQGKYKETKKYDSLLLPVAIALKDSNLLSNVYNRMGICEIENGRAKEAEKKFQLALSFGLELQPTIKSGEIFSNLGSAFLSIGDKDKAVEWFFKALKIFESKKSEKGMGETYSNIASVYYLMGRTDDAIDFQKKSIAVREHVNDMAGLVITHANIGQLYILKDSFFLALEYLKKGVEYADKLKNPRLQGSAYSGISSYYSRSKDFKTALEWQIKAIKIFEEADNKQILSRLYVAAGISAAETNDSTLAVNYYNKALQLSLSLANKENIANANEKLSLFYTAKKDHNKALDYYKKYVLYRDSIAANSALSKIEEIRTRYETEKKDNEIAALTAEQRIKILQIEKQEALILGNHLEAQKKEDEIKLLSKERELQELHISQQEELLQREILLSRNKEQQLQLAEKEQQLQSRQLKTTRLTRNFVIGGVVLLALLGYFLFNRYQLKRKIKEQENLLAIRNNIAKDLHDEIGSALTSIKILSEVSGKNLNKDQQKASSFIQKIVEQSTAAQQGMSDIVWAVKPENDKLENIIVRMREYIGQSLEPKNIQTQFYIDEEVLSKVLTMAQRRDFFLLFKEAVNNIAKHAKASEVIIQLTKNGEVLTLEINDNGKGFDKRQERSSSGLKNMQERARSLGGELHIESAHSKGTMIQLSIPVAT